MEAETSTFMTDLLGGRLGVDAYARYTEQLWFVYEALESGARDLASDPVAGPFIRPELYRLSALERDLEHLRGPRRRTTLTALPATREYADRVATVARGIHRPSLHPLPGRPLGRSDHPRQGGEDLGIQQEGQRIVAECERAFGLNPRVFRALGEEFPLSA